MGGKSLPLQLSSRRGLARLMRHPLAHIAQWRSRASPKNGPCVHYAPSPSWNRPSEALPWWEHGRSSPVCPCSKRPEQHVAMAATRCVTHTSYLANRCKWSNRPAQRFYLANRYIAGSKTKANPMLLGAHDRVQRTAYC